MLGSLFYQVSYKDGNNTKQINPGFIDSHSHFLLAGLELTGIDLSNAWNITLFKNAVINGVNNNDNETWIVGGGWNEFDCCNGILPTKNIIDPISKGHPIILSHIDRHMVQNLFIIIRYWLIVLH